MLDKPLRILVGIFLALNVLAINAVSAESMDRATLENQAALALDGFDPTAYFDLGGAKRGSDTYQAVYQGQRYLFTSAANQQKFANNPAQFLPQFGALCAHSQTLEKDVLANPAIYAVQHGKLYMFASEDARDIWTQDTMNQLIAANKNWMFRSEKRQAQIAAKKRWKKDNSVKLFSF